MPDPVQGVQVVVSEPDNAVRVDPVTGTIERDQQDGGVVVQLDAFRPQADASGSHYDNLVGKLSQQRLAQIAQDLHEQISADKRSRGNYLEIRKRGMEFMGLELKEPRANVGDTSAPVEGMSTVTNPLLAQAVFKGWANAQAELLPTEGPVKVKDEADPNTDADQDLADALERDTNHYLTVTASEYYPDTSHMLLWGTIFGGSGFKKIYRCPLRQRPVSESVDAEFLIVSDTTKDLKSCARITHEIKMRPSLLKRMQKIGAYRSTPLPQPQAPQVSPIGEQVAAIQGTDPSVQRPEDNPYLVWETQCELDLPEFTPSEFKESGIPLPYLVTMDSESRDILAIHRNWEEDDEQCRREQMWVKYPYVPGPGFYGTGLLHILGNASAAMTAAWRLALDNGMFANFPSAVAAKLAGRQNSSDIRVGPGTLAMLDTAGQDIRAVVAPLPYRDITAGFLSLMDKITTQAAQLGGAAEVAVAEGVQDVPVGTMLAQVEQATKIMAAAHKGMHQAQAEEIRLLVILFRRNPEDFWKGNESCPQGYWTAEKFERAVAACDLVPSSDPNTPSYIHRLAKALARVQLTTNPALAPRLNVDAILQAAFRTLHDDPSEFILPPPQPVPPQPDPNMIKAAAALTSAQAQQAKVQITAATAQSDAQSKLTDDQTERDIATTNLAKELVIHRGDAAHNAGQLGLQTAQAVHDANLGLAQHALEVHKTLNLPQPDSEGSP